MDRRSFIRTTALSSAGVLSAFHIPKFEQAGKLKIGLIGAGWYGMVIAKSALKTGEAMVSAVCDVDSNHLKTSADELEKLQGSRPKEYKDYRELLDQKGLQAIFIGTVPHWHALQFIAACEKGYDIYCEKPLAYDVKEGEAMLAAASKTGNIVQVGFQRRQAKSYRKVKELINSGITGKIHEIEAHIHFNPKFKETTIQEPPASLDWEAWCGPAPKLGYSPNIGHFHWRLEKEYGNGHLVDWGIHHIDIVREIMGLDMPVLFESNGGIQVHEEKMTTPDTLHARMEFEDCSVTWLHRLWGTGELQTNFNNGIYFYGDKATLFANDRTVIKMPAGKNKEQEIMNIPTEGMGDKHVADFIRAVKTKDQSLISCPVEEALKSTSSVQLAMISYYTGSEVKWDIKKQHIVDNSKATMHLARTYRGHYERP